MSKYFTKNPHERDMQRPPKPKTAEKERLPAGHKCYECPYLQDNFYCMYCIKELTKKEVAKFDKN
jgi:hypothetical protein